MQPSIYIEILTLLRKMQQNNRFIIEDNETGLNLIESAALLEIDTFQRLSVPNLARHLNVPRSTASQTASKLRQRNLISVEPPDSEGNAREMVVSPKGKRLLQQYDETSNAMLQSFTVGFSVAERRRFAEFLRELADHRCPVPGKLRGNDAPIRLEMRRLTIAFGLLARRFRNSEFSLAEWNTLSELAGDPCRAADLMNRLSLAQNYISQILRNLARRKLITRTADPEDKRAQIVSLTERGKRALDAVTENIVEQIRQSFARRSVAQIEDFRNLLFRFTRSEQERGVELGADLVLRPLSDAADRNRCRVLYVRETLRRGTDPVIPETLFRKTAKVFGLFRKEELVGAIEMAPDAGQLAGIYLAGVSARQWRAFVSRAARYVKTK